MAKPRIVLAVFLYFLFLIFFMGMGYRSVVLAVSDWKDYRYLQSTGVSVEATILELTPPAFRMGNNIKYRYEAKDSTGETRTYEGIGNIVLSPKYFQLENAKTVSILYDPSDPTHSRVKDNADFMADTAFLIPSLLGLLALLGPFLIIGLSRLRHRKTA